MAPTTRSGPPHAHMYVHVQVHTCVRALTSWHAISHDNPPPARRGLSHHVACEVCREVCREVCCEVPREMPYEVPCEMPYKVYS